MRIVVLPPSDLAARYAGGEQLNIKNGKVHLRPMINIDKQGVCEIYSTLNVNDLFSITRSCEDITTNFHHGHCGDCWFCRERLWGFNKLC